MRGVLLAAIMGTYAALGHAAYGQSVPKGPVRRSPAPAVKPKETVKEGPTEVAALVQGNNAFAVELYDKLRDPQSNLFFSPYSISNAFSMAYAGARKETAAQMAKVLHFNLSPEAMHPACAEYTRRITTADPKKSGYELTVANALWGQKGYNFLPEYLEVTNKHYGAGLREVDFIGSKTEACKIINGWVEEKTRQKIKDLIKPDALDVATRLVLTNAIYFKGIWASQFSKGQTRDEPFTLPSGQEVNVPMMHKREKYSYADLGDAQALRLPYQGDAVAMTILLPKRADGISDLQKQLTAAKLQEWQQRLRGNVEVQLTLPRFQMTCEFQLNQAMKSLGMRDAFTPDAADFSGMNGRKDLYISAALHKAFVDVNEEGTEAAAATGIVVGVTAMPMEPIVFRADHPFIFIIQETGRHNGILFIGRVMNPKQ